jgi:hypothetical protein
MTKWEADAWKVLDAIKLREMTLRRQASEDDIVAVIAEALEDASYGPVGCNDDGYDDDDC